MKIPFIGIVLLAIGRIGLQAQTPTTAATQGNVPAPTDYQIVQQDGNSRVWQWEIYEQEPNGQIVAHLHQFTELATGLNYKDSSTGQWQPSKEEIDIQPDGTLAATQGQHQVYFPRNIYGGEIELIQPDGVQLHSCPVGLSYDDGSNTVLIAVLTNSIGQLVGANQMIYTNAFVGLDADLLYTYTQAGLEQDVVIRAQPPTPASLGLNPDTTRLQVLTEFFDPPQPAEATSTLPEQAGLALTDDTLDFGTMQMIPGKAFMLGEDSPSARVGKSWITLQGRQFLVEAVPVAALAEQLDSLPAPATQTASTTKTRVISRNLVLPPQHLAKAGVQSLKLARTGISLKPGVVLDYLTVNSSLTNYTFRGDTTYYISGTTYSYGTNTFEGGAVLKYATNSSINMQGSSGTLRYPTIIWKGSSYRPVIFTAKDDNSVGDAISGSTGSPSGYYANPALDVIALTALNISGFRFTYAQEALVLGQASGTLTFENGQFINCANGFNDSINSANLENVLFENVQTDFFNLEYATINVENSTFSSSSYLTTAAPGDSYQTLVPTFYNCVFANVTNLTNNPNGTDLTYGVSGTYNGFYFTPLFGYVTVNDSLYPFQTMGAGKCYLTNSCVFHDAGVTTGIDPALLASLTNKTTYAPIVYSNITITTNLVLGLQASRDTNNLPDLGYHYDPIDYIVDKLAITNATLTLTNGVAIATYNEGGVELQDHSSIVSIGSPFSPNWCVRYSSVQEVPVSLGGTTNYNGVTVFPSYISAMPGGQFQFSKFACPAGGGDHLYDYNTASYSNLLVQECEFWSGANNYGGTNGSVMDFRNNLYARSMISAYGSGVIAFTNNLVWGTAAIWLNPSSGVAWTAVNNDFDSSTITNSVLTNGYNAYLNCSGYLMPTNSTDLFATNSLIYQTSYFGSFYQPTNSLLIGMGSTTANLVGLYHYTVTTNQIVEGDNIVSIGYHYVAANTNGNPVCTPNDGIPDYIADANGNGIDDPGEVPWDLAIASQPQSVNVAQGQNAAFSVVASGTGPFTYQWLQNGSEIPGANANNYTLFVAQPSEAGYAYSVIVSNSDGPVTSSNAILSVTTPISWIGGPSSLTLAQGATASFSVTNGGNYLAYQWYANSVPLSNGSRVSGVTTSNLTISGVLPSDAAGYSVVVTNLFGTAPNQTATLTVLTNPWISSFSPHVSTNAVQSQDVLFSVNASGAQNYQWWFSNSIVNTNIPGANGPNYSQYTQLVVQTNNAGFYSVIITNLAGSTNVGATMAVLIPPWVTQQPLSVVTNQGSNITFNATAFGTTNLYYQWFKNGTNAITGATNASLTLSNVQATAAAGYSILVTNIAGTNMSAWAWLSVTLTGGSTTNGWGSGASPPAPSPSVSMLSPTNSSPTNAAVYLYGNPIPIRALAFSTNSYITNVAFYFTGTNYGTNFMLAGTAVPGPDTQFALAWTNMLPGTNILKARAWDCNGKTSDSGLVYVIMAVAPSISAGPGTNIVWTEGASGTNILLSGSITNDGQPYSYVTNIQWSVISSNGQYVTISNPNSLTTQVTFATNGIFQMQLQVNNNFATNYSYCSVTINRHPRIYFNSPTNGSDFLTGSPLVLTVTALPYDGTVTSVTYYTNSGFLGTAWLSLSNSWTYYWQNPPLWANTIYAVAADNDGLSSTTSVTTTVLPLVAVQILSPTNQTYIAQTNVTVTADALYAAGSETVDWVQFFDGTNSLGYAVSTNNIFQINWIPIWSGTNVLTALAFNANGSNCWSLPVTNYVRSLPTVEISTPVNGQIFTISPTNLTITAIAAAYGAGATVSEVVFYQGTNAIGTNTTGSPYSITLANVTNGIYALSAQVIDNLGESGVSSNIVITVYQTNQPPSVYAGLGQTINLAVTNTALLNGYVTDDGLPLGSVLSINWTNFLGPAKAQIINSNQASTAVVFTNVGTYQFTLSASDSQYTITNNLAIVVISNRPPVVYGGPNKNLTNQVAFELQGNASDDGLPYGILTATWTMISGPDVVYFANPNLTNTIITLNSPDEEGTYDLRLTASDGQLTTSSDVFITISASDSIPYKGSNYLYMLISTNLNGLTNTYLTNFYLTNFNETGFLTGQAGFGNDTDTVYDATCPLESFNNINTDWPGHDNHYPFILLRNHFVVPSGTTNLNMGFTIDNNCLIYVNGIEITPTNVVQAIYADGSDEGYGNNWLGGGVDVLAFWHNQCPSYDDLVLNGIATNIWHVGSNVVAVCVYDDSYHSFFDMRISYNPIYVSRTNDAPIVSVGPNQIIEGTNVSIPLTGVVIDDGLPGTGLHQATWTNVSGPGTVTFTQTNFLFTNYVAADTSAEFSAPGKYTLMLIANDSLLSASNTMSVSVFVPQTITNSGGPVTLGPPSLYFSAPPYGSSNVIGATIPVTAIATASTGVVAEVEFFAALNGLNNALIGVSTNTLATNTFTINWTPTEAGTYSLSAEAIDGGGRSGMGSYPNTVTLQIAGDQQPVAANDNFTVLANSQNNVLNPLANDTDPSHYSLFITGLSSLGVTNESITTYNGGTATIINNGTAISYTPPVFCAGGDGFTYFISDGHGDTAAAGIYINIVGEALPSVILVAANSTTNAGAIDPLTAIITNVLNIASVSFYQGTTLLGTVTNGSAGNFTYNWQAAENSCGGCGFTAQATDIFGQVNTSPEIDVNVTTSGLSGNVNAELSRIIDSQGTNIFSTTNLVTIRDGKFQLYGEAYHSLGSNVVWQLDVYTVNGTLVKNLASGSNSVTSTSSPMCTNDLTTLINGVYTLQLTVTGGYQTTQTSVQFRLESNLKVGEFSFSQQDLVIPVNNIPLSVTRTYNSINPNKGDFGYGWTYALNNMAVSLDETRQNAVDSDGNQFSERSGGSWDVTLTLPNGQITTFAFSIVAASEYGTYQAEWTAAPGVTATLTTLDNAILYDFSGFTSLATPEWTSGESDDVPVDNFDFKNFMLKTVDGTEYIISREDLDDHFMNDGSYIHAYGQPYLSQIIERDGDTISISSSAIVFQATNGASRQITFQRNTDGLITAISDPNAQTNNGPPAVEYQYDNNDNLIAVLNLVNAGAGVYVTNCFSYTNTTFIHYITGIINANGNQVARNFYDSSGRLTEVEDANGYLTQFIHNLTNNSETIIDKLGYTNIYVYDPFGNVILQTNQMGQVTTMSYDASNNKTNSVTYLNGVPYATNSYTYNNLNLMLTATDPLGNTTIYTYNTNGDLLTTTDARVNCSTNIYDSNGNLIETLDALGITNSNVYSDGLIISSQDPLQTTMHNTYDSYENLASTATIDTSGNILSTNTYYYDANGNRTNSTAWRRVSGAWTSATTTYGYDAENRVILTIDPDGGETQITYDNLGNQQGTVDQNGNMVVNTYDIENRLIESENWSPDVFEMATNYYSYDANGNKTASIDADGWRTSYVYDPLNRLSKTIFSDGSTNINVYDSVGRMAQTIDARGTITAFYYDPAGRQLAVTNAEGTVFASTNFYGYDNDGNEITFTDSNNHTTTNVFDSLNRQIQTIYPDATRLSTGYDAAGRKVAETNQLNKVTLFGYDGSGRLVSVTNAMNQVTRYQYDESGNEIAQIDALNRTNTYAYDGQGRRVAHWLPNNSIEQFAYDLDGNLVFQTNFDGTVINKEYDGMNRLKSVASLDYTYYVGYTYSPTGQRTIANGSYFYNTYTYDNRDRLIQKNITEDNISGDYYQYYQTTLNYAYDINGNVTNIWTGDNNLNIYYGFDPLNRLTNVLDTVSGTLAAYSYDNVGNLQVTHYGNGVTNVYQYDSLNRLTNLVWQYSGAPRAQFAYQLDPTGARSNLNETVNSSSQTYAWSYDNIYRLTNEIAGMFGSVAYRYDVVGNRTNRNSSITVLTNQNFAFTTNDWLVGDSYSPNGNTTNSWGKFYQYDEMNELTNANNTAYITYDGDGNRISKTVGASTTYYIVDDLNPSGYPQVVEEFVNSGSSSELNKSYIYGLNLIGQQQFNLTTQAPTTLSYYGYDGHGSVRFLMNTTGAITDTYTYDAYGTLISQSGSTPNNYLYSGQQYDSDLGLYNNRARYFNPNTGRFWTMDSYAGNQEDPLSIHKYLYGADNPVDGSDPSGHDDIGDVMGAMDISAGLDGLNMAVTTQFGAKTVSSLMPRTLYVRSFAPWKTFGGSFSGDDRTFTTAHAPGGAAHSVAGATSRITSIIKFLPMPLAILSETAYSDPSHNSVLGTATATPHIFSYVTGTTMHMKMSGAVPLVPFAPDIDVKMDMTVTSGTVQNHYNGQVYGDAFPDAEVFIVDPSEHATVLDDFSTKGGRETGPAEYLPGDNNRPMGAFSIDIKN
jgi:RHS repeat-associated protein